MEFSFKASQSFVLREGWVQKAIIELSERPNVNVFSKRDGVIYLGIGSNMVTALKYWLDAAGIITSNAKKIPVLTPFGKMVKEYDPYLESSFVWQLIHLRLIENKKAAPLFWVLFNVLRPEESFSKESFCEEASMFIAKNNAKPNPQYIDDDFSVLMRSYISTSKSDPEDNMDCPLSSLGLIKQLSRDQYRKQSVSLEILDPRIVLLGICESAAGKDTIAFDDVVATQGGPCSAFNLDRNSLMTVVLRLSNMGYLSLAKTAGLNTIYLKNKSFSLKEAFEDYFGGKK